MRRAIEIRDEWLGHGLSVDPADRAAAEAAITELYRLIGRRAPRFVWVDSPRAALPLLPDDQRRPLRLRIASALSRGADWPFFSRLAGEMSELRHLPHRNGGPPRPLGLGRRIAEMTPQEALEAGWSPARVHDETVGASLGYTLRDQVAAPLRTELDAPEIAGRTWYGQHDAHWIADVDVRLRVGALRVHPAEGRRLDVWATVARSCGWWWSGEDVCVVTERPAVVRAEPLPGGLHGQRRLHSEDGAAVRFRDGWGVYSWHGTRVPSWVVTDPTVERIHREDNVEVRRSAIERIGWDAYIEQAGLRLVAEAADPGNPGCVLRLYDVPWGSGGTGRVLLAVNGSVDRDGHRRRYGLSVPAGFDDPVAAAGWSYGLTRAQYAQLARRT
ncbi:DUF6745 domain-containing protein [Actinomadura sp. NBRC 104425]|uniref:DUF6745 domain-containing protein n=1 Tax=Actinomadura sp. NBRC 104425 TaxID=3032204 RepID=UPI002552C8A3|nr:hypothetical protein [Actinomadura sp. NBRC 104425]